MVHGADSALLTSLAGPLARFADWPRPGIGGHSAAANGGDRADVLTQLAAAAPALNRAEFKIISSGLGRCVLSSEEGREQAEADRLQLEKLFLARA